MPKFFNTAGPCRPEWHYMLPPERRLPGVRELIEQRHFFVIHAPRQSGKTTCFGTLAERLTAEGRYAALLSTCETGQKLEPDLEGSIAAVVDTLRQRARESLPEPLRPPEVDPRIPAETRLRDVLSRWTRECPRPVVLFLDEIDSLYADALISVLRQLRSGYDSRPEDFPQSVALIGLRDVRDYRLLARADEESLGTSSPFNVKVRSLTLENFTAEEVAELFAQHTVETGQAFAPEAIALAHELTGGQPWLVNALADQIVREEASDPALTISTAEIERAKEVLILRRETYFDWLAGWLRTPGVGGVIVPVLAGELIGPKVQDDDVLLAKDLGFVVSSWQGLHIANPIYRETFVRALNESIPYLENHR